MFILNKTQSFFSLESTIILYYLNQLLLSAMLYG